MPFPFKRIAAPLILASFLMVVFFGFAAMSQGPDGHMQGGCPFSATGSSFCPQNAVAVVMHHISAFQSFLNVPVGIYMTALILALLIFGVIIVLFASPPVFIHTVPIRFLYESPPLVSYNKKLMRWFSLLEYTP